jgi:EmrB/QacA subfamily drug resistance transporter
MSSPLEIKEVHSNVALGVSGDLDLTIRNPNNFTISEIELFISTPPNIIPTSSVAYIDELKPGEERSVKFRAISKSVSAEAKLYLIERFRVGDARDLITVQSFSIPISAKTAKFEILSVSGELYPDSSNEIRVTFRNSGNYAKNVAWSFRFLHPLSISGAGSWSGLIGQSQSGVYFVGSVPAGEVAVANFKLKADKDAGSGYYPATLKIRYEDEEGYLKDSSPITISMAVRETYFKCSHSYSYSTLCNRNYSDFKVRKEEEKMSLIKSWLAFLPVSAGLFMVLLDVSVLNVALPQIAKDFGATMTELQWIVNAYTPTMAAHSRNVESLIVFRILQAVGGTILSGNTLAIAAELFPPGRRGEVMGLNAILMASSFTLGPIIGGWLTTHMSWHWVFYINVPVGIFAIFGALLLLPPLGARERMALDLPSVAVFGVAIFTLTLGIIEGQNWGWRDEKTIACFLISAPYILAFIFREMNYDKPLIDLNLFKIRNFSVCIAATSILFFGISASLFVLPYFLQGLKFLSAEEAGYWLIAMPLMNSIVAPIAGRISDRMNPKYMMAFGAALYSLGLFNLSHVDVNIGFWEFFMLTVPMGIGMGMLMSPSMNVILSSVPIEKAGMTNGVLRLMNTVGQTLGVAVGGVLVTAKMSEWIPNYGNQVPDPGTMSFLASIARFNQLPLAL